MTLTKMYQIDTAPPEALVIHCSDPRFQTAFRRFVTEELGLRNYAPLVIGGSIHTFGYGKFLPENCQVLREQVKFLLSRLSIRQVIMITHQDCLWHKTMSALHSREQSSPTGQEDLSTATQILQAGYAGIRVRSFFAALNGDIVTFSEVKMQE